MKSFSLFVATSFVSALVIPQYAAAVTSETVRTSAAPATPNILNNSEKKQYAEIFSAISSQQWNEAQRLIDKAGDAPLAYMAQAELYLAANSPRVEAPQLEALLNKAPYLPQAERLESLAFKRGASNLPQRPGTQRFSYLGSAPKRNLPDDISDAAGLRSEINVFIRNDDPASAERLVESRSSSLSTPALTELRYRVAWSYYIENQDENARRVAQKAMANGGDWGVQAHWVNALANWRLGNQRAALESFDHVSRFASDDDLRAAGLFWSARAAMAVKMPEQVQVRLQNAARLPETFYGLLASEALGMEPLAAKQARNAALNWNALKNEKNVQIAVGLSEIGQTNLADETLRFQARIGDSSKHSDLAKLAGSLNLPATQLWMGHYGPSGGNPDATTRYPSPSWTPSGGWRVDSNLVYAHALQESQFRTSVISPAGAQGLMQVRPGTAGDIARARGMSFSRDDLNNPSINLEYGQSYMEQLRDMSATQGLLPKVIAAYNAGPAPIARWNDEVKDNGDPLLFVESIPYWETRGYVAIILRNYWIYESSKGKNSDSMTGLAQYMWPTFPGKDGRSVAVRANGLNGGTSIGVNSFADR
ncbi:lytic transglycosylase domain-containing protein [Sphingorhabdus arenilitoris]|uniref:Lytic transglycosylase domain-containing protein n=1 Tax=Sphingorhabdus arenilitoris TaxID=1490041 RepID=A0ABV8RFK3_9SPHN